MAQEKKLSLEELKIQSFITTLENQEKIKGGWITCYNCTQTCGGAGCGSLPSPYC